MTCESLSKMIGDTRGPLPTKSNAFLLITGSIFWIEGATTSKTHNKSIRVLRFGVTFPRVMSCRSRKLSNFAYDVHHPEGEGNLLLLRGRTLDLLEDSGPVIINVTPRQLKDYDPHKNMTFSSWLYTLRIPFTIFDFFLDSVIPQASTATTAKHMLR